MSKSKPLLAPYRSLGLFVDENKPFLFHAGNKEFLLASTSHSFKLYKLPELKVKLLGPSLPNKIRAVTAHNNNIILAAGNKIYRFQNYHLVDVYQKTEGKISCLLSIGEILIIASQKGEIVAHGITTPNDIICSFKVNFAPKAIIHPPTYLNKILIIGDKAMELRNIRTTNLIYDFMAETSALHKYILDKLNQKPSYIVGDALKKKASAQLASISFLCAENSPALDVVAIGLSNGEVVLHNLKKDEIVQVYRLKDSRPVTLAFSHTDLPLLAVGNDRGDVAIFNLNDENILSIMKNVHKSSVNFLEFFKEELVLLTGSYSDNSILMWQFDELEDSKFKMIRKRSGLAAPIRKLGFYGDEGYHVLASSFGEQAEIKDFFLWNEGFEGNFSMKKNKNLQRMSFNTENIQETSQIIDFSFASNRAKDWSNLLTCHKNFDKPYLWSTEDHTLIKKNVQWDTQPGKAVQITKVFVTQCGNFGIIGYADGNIVKINMQSGKQQTVFHAKLAEPIKQGTNTQAEIHTTAITGLFVDPYNSVLVSADIEHCLVSWDFYSGKVNRVINTYPSKLTLLKPSKTSNLFCVVYEDFTIEIYDQYTFNKGRTFRGHKNRVMDVCFTKNNRHVVSSSLDCTIKVWDIISSQIINNLQLKTPVISLDFDPSGEFLVTAFSNSKEVFIWNNRIGKEVMGNDEPLPIKFVSKVNQGGWTSLREKYSEKAKKETLAETVQSLSEKDINDLGEFFANQNRIQAAEQDESLIHFFEQDIGKWLPLINFDEIKEKNKPKQPVSNNVSAPFFLEFDNRYSLLAKKVEGGLMEEEKAEEKVQSKIVRNLEKNEFLEEVASGLGKLVKSIKKDKDNKKVYKKMLEEMKRLTPAQLDYETRTLTFGTLENVEAFIAFFNYMFQEPNDYDLKQIYFNNFIKVCSDVLITNSSLASQIAELRGNVDLYWKTLNDQINSNMCMVQHFAQLKM